MRRFCSSLLVQVVRSAAPARETYNPTPAATKPAVSSENDFFEIEFNGLTQLINYLNRES
jgi:hypothetical protein